MLPMLLTFLVSLATVLVDLGSKFGLLHNFIFKPLLISTCVAFFYGMISLPLMLQWLEEFKVAPIPRAATSDRDAHDDVEMYVDGGIGAVARSESAEHPSAANGSVPTPHHVCEASETTITAPSCSPLDHADDDSTAEIAMA